MSKPFVLLKLDNEYEFRLDNRAAFLYEELSGKSFTEIGEGFGIKDLNYLVYAGIKRNAKHLSLDDVIDLIDDHIDIETLSSMVEKAMAQSTFFKMAKSQEEHPAKKK